MIAICLLCSSRILSSSPTWSLFIMDRPMQLYRVAQYFGRFNYRLLSFDLQSDCKDLGRILLRSSRAARWGIVRPILTVRSSRTCIFHIFQVKMSLGDQAVFRFSKRDRFQITLLPPCDLKFKNRKTAWSPKLFLPGKYGKCKFSSSWQSEYGVQYLILLPVSSWAKWDQDPWNLIENQARKDDS